MMLFIFFFCPVLGYSPLSYYDIISKLDYLSKTCPFMSLTTAQDEYKLPNLENCDGCVTPIVKISNSSLEAPQVYFSGCLHGDERLGPTIVTELISFLCENYSKNL